MRLSVKRGGDLINELRFSRGPIYIGRQIGSQIFLPDKAVSRHHTVIYTTTDGKWIVEDLDSVNKTYLNDKAIHKAEIKNGDVLKVADFRIEVHVDESGKQGPSVSLEDTLHATLHEAQTVFRHLDSADAPLMRMQASRGKDFSYAATAICRCLDIQELLATLVDLLFRQFSPFHAWAALRKNPAEAMEVSNGRKSSGQAVRFEELYLGLRISEAIKNHCYILVTRLPMQQGGDKIGSAIIAPIICEGECFGVLYADNSLDHEHYSLNDLDYLILVSLAAGAFVRNV